MHDLTKIPFGLREADNEFVDVAEVPNGKRCGCVCPSCHTPLEARQGEHKVWHFAHAGRKAYGKTRNECEFSFYVSIRMMAKQLLGKQLSLGLPPCRGQARYFDAILGYRDYKDFLVTQERDITLENLAIESTFSGTVVDVLGTVKGYNLAVYFTHPGRSVPASLSAPENTKCGVVAIALDTLPVHFKAAKLEGRSYQEILMDFLSKDRTTKTWIYHPNYKSCETKALEELARVAQERRHAEKIAQYGMYQPILEKKSTQTQAKLQLSTPNVTKLVKFECVICKVTWEGNEAGGNICPCCASHLYSKQIASI